MKPLLNSQLKESLSAQPAVRITTEISALKDFDMLNAIKDTTYTVSWNKSRLLMEYRAGTRQEVGRLHREIMTTYKMLFPRSSKIFAKNRWA